VRKRSGQPIAQAVVHFYKRHEPGHPAQNVSPDNPPAIIHLEPKRVVLQPELPERALDHHQGQARQVTFPGTLRYLT
jgi:hypothetical protein